MDQAAHTRDQQRHHGGQRVKHNPKGYAQTAGVNPLPGHRLNAAGVFRHASEANDGDQRNEEGHAHHRTSDETGGALLANDKDVQEKPHQG